MNNSQYSVKTLLSGFYPIIVWSSVAAIVKFFSLPNEGLKIAFYSILFGSIFSLVFLLLKDRKSINKNISLIKSTPKLLILIFMTGIFICLHYFSLYYIFSTDYVIQGNIINYMWPLFYVILANIFIKEKNKDSKSSDLLFVFMSFIGAILIVSGDELSITFINNWKMLLISLLSAISASIYFLLSTKIKNSLSGKFTHFTLPLIISCSILLIIYILNPNIIETRSEIIILGGFLGFASIFLANTSWIVSIHTNQNNAFSSLAYFIPVFSTIIIFYFNNEPYNNYIFAGLILIVISNILIHFSKEIVHAVNICFAIIILYSGIILLVAPIDNASAYSYITIISTVFTFFAAFLSNRVWNQNKDNEMILAEIIYDTNIFIDNLKVSNDEKSHILDSFKKEILLQNRFFSIKTYLYTLYTHYNEKIPKNLYLLVRKLNSLNLSAVTFPELLILVLLSMVSSVYVILYRDTTIIGSAMSIVFASSVSYITYLLYDSNKIKPINKQKIFSLFDNYTSYTEERKIIPNILSFFLLLCIFIIFIFISTK